MEDKDVLRASRYLSQEMFRLLATPPDVIKSGRNASKVLCTTCSIVGVKLQTCQRCKSVWYCSKECQKSDWPHHKTFCTPTDRSKGLLKLMEILVANTTISILLEVCAVLDLNLLNDEKKDVGFKYPFMICVDIGIEPTDMLDFVKICLTDEPIPEKVQGMIQINHFFSHLPGRFGCDPITAKREKLWHRARDEANNNGRGGDPFGLMEFVTDSGFSITIPFGIHPLAHKLAKDAEPFTTVSAITGTVTRKPMTVETCMEFINHHVRSDKQNQLKLRTELTESDKAVIRDVPDKSVFRDAVLALRGKMARETLYAHIPRR